VAALKAVIPGTFAHGVADFLVLDAGNMA